VIDFCTRVKLKTFPCGEKLFEVKATHTATWTVAALLFKSGVRPWLVRLEAQNAK